MASGALQCGHHPSAGPCCACGHARGVFDYHTEDYGEPFGPHIYAHRICYRCHMMLHCRFSSPAAFERYVQCIRDGLVFQAPCGRDFGAIKAQLAGIDQPAIRVLLVSEKSWFDTVLRDQSWKEKL